MLGTGNGPERHEQMRDRVVPRVDRLVASAKEQGALRPDIEPVDLPIIQLMLGAVTEHTGSPELWRRYLALMIDGMRARPDTEGLPAAGHPSKPDLVTRSERDASRGRRAVRSGQ